MEIEVLHIAIKMTAEDDDDDEDEDDNNNTTYHILWRKQNRQTTKPGNIIFL